MKTMKSIKKSDIKNDVLDDRRYTFCTIFLSINTHGKNTYPFKARLRI